MTGVSVDSHPYQDFVSIRDASEDDDVGRFLKNRNALYWQIRNRQRNGLDDASAVFKGKDGQWWINKPAYLAWFTQELEVQPHE